VLPRANRIVDGSDLRRVSRKGRRTVTPYFIVSVVEAHDGDTRYGFVVSKQVGGSVVRNRVKRRLRSLAQVSLKTSTGSRDVVVRALPAAAGASFADLSQAWEKVFS
jgi:ribonuclease P protein component